MYWTYFHIQRNENACIERIMNQQFTETRKISPMTIYKCLYTISEDSITELKIAFLHLTNNGFRKE